MGNLPVSVVALFVFALGAQAQVCFGPPLRVLPDKTEGNLTYPYLMRSGVGAGEAVIPSRRFSLYASCSDPLVAALRRVEYSPIEEVKHPWGKIHLVHVSGLHHLRNRFLRSLYTRKDWLSLTKVYPLVNLVPGRLHFGIEARRVLWVETDHRYAILARQGGGESSIPFSQFDSRLALTFRVIVPFN